MIAQQSDGMEELAAAGPGGIGIHHLRLARFALLAGTAAVLVGLYIATKHFLSIEGGVTAEQTRAFSVDIGESCLQGTAVPPVFDAREGDRIVLTVTSCTPAHSTSTGWKRSSISRPARKPALHLPPSMRGDTICTSMVRTKTTPTPKQLFSKLRRVSRP